MPNHALIFGSTGLIGTQLLRGPRSETRIGEKVGEWIFAMSDPFLRGNATKYRSIEGRDVARAMIFAALRNVPSATLHFDTVKSWSNALEGS